MTEYLLVAALVFAINLMPAFGPPTSIVLVALTFNSDLEPAPLIACGAIAAAGGRLVLATACRHFRPRLSEQRRANLAAAETLLLGNRAKAAAGLGLFALSPVPSGQLFVAAGLLEVRLVPLTVAFFCGRVVSYTIYVVGASAVEESVGDAIGESLTSPVGIAIQLLALAGLVALLRVDWVGLLALRERARASEQRRTDVTAGSSGAPPRGA
jgi:uncharacterized membrane protein YdjX (TVP38/TMEM64 family)